MREVLFAFYAALLAATGLILIARAVVFVFGMVHG